MSEEEEVVVSRRFRRLCDEFARILGGEGEIEEGPVCFVTKPTELNREILGRETHSPLVQAQLFSFEALDDDGLALCLGETAISQNLANRLIRRLQSHGIRVTALHNHWLFEEPRLMYVHWEAIMDPIEFATSTAESLAFLGGSVEDTDEEVPVSRRFRRLCDRFAEILGDESEIVPGPVCFVSNTVEIDVEILGRPTNSPLVNYQLFSFEALDDEGLALCLGETAVFQDQANQIVRNLQDRGITVTAFHNHWQRERPRLIYIHWEAIMEPIEFAEKTRESVAFLEE